MACVVICEWRRLHLQSGLAFFYCAFPYILRFVRETVWMATQIIASAAMLRIQSVLPCLYTELYMYLCITLRTPENQTAIDTDFEAKHSSNYVAEPTILSFFYENQIMARFRSSWILSCEISSCKNRHINQFLRLTLMSFCYRQCRRPCSNYSRDINFIYVYSYVIYSHKVQFTDFDWTKSWQATTYYSSLIEDE